MPLSTAVEAIVRSDNEDLLRRFLSETGEIKVIDGALVTDQEEHSPEGVPVSAMVNFRFGIFSSESPKDL